MREGVTLRGERKKTQERAPQASRGFSQGRGNFLRRFDWSGHVPPCVLRTECLSWAVVVVVVVPLVPLHFPDRCPLQRDLRIRELFCPFFLIFPSRSEAEGEGLLSRYLTRKGRRNYYPSMQCARQSCQRAILSAATHFILYQLELAVW